MRHDRLHHAWQGELKKNLQQFFQWQHVKADPEICQIILKDLAKKKHRALPASVDHLLQTSSQTSPQTSPQTPTLTEDDSFRLSDYEDNDYETVSKNL